MQLSDLISRYSTHKLAFPILGCGELMNLVSSERVYANIPDKPSIYLSCRLTGVSKLRVSKWQREVQAYCDANNAYLIDPKDHRNWNNFGDYLARDNCNTQLIVAIDHLLIYHSALLILDTTKGPSFGATAETIYAKSLGLPVIAVVRDKEPVSFWVNQYTNCRTKPYKAAYWVSTFYPKVMGKD